MKYGRKTKKQDRTMGEELLALVQPWADEKDWKRSVRTAENI